MLKKEFNDVLYKKKYYLILLLHILKFLRAVQVKHRKFRNIKIVAIYFVLLFFLFTFIGYCLTTKPSYQRITTT